ncbi:pilus assembly protein N-terminal domain-containing protein [Roseisolibacter sp. H3M3-2]|uniref:type II and III secretion system protein family protein n=1 Tax=Roseisolibacter sp. H3M3-2 TaxID=3031323 RepID=UPI0023DBCBD0|nr:pilus assembly protein N-terminal domain-containing protein [Roseisolibacter sp. H3M3-2]MDF1501872.1 pilus assembly protein N-terminal domain-containing protein [Roseisolibacter sp. H3M3-2]
MAVARLVAAGLIAAAAPSALLAQGEPVRVERLDLSAGRSLALQSPVAITRVTVATPEVADVVVVGTTDLVINGKAGGETDVLVFGANNYRRHYRVVVGTPSDRPQVVLSVKLAEVRRDNITQAGLSGLYRGENARAGTGLFGSDNPFSADGSLSIPSPTRFLTVLTDFGTKDLLAFIEAEQQKGRARILAEPNLMAANRDSASFLAGGEFPVPLAQPGPGGVVQIVISFREFGVKLNFSPEILNDSLVKLKVRPEVSSLDFTNAVTLSGFRIPALRTRRVESTVDVRRDRSLIISGLFNEERERVRTGIPLLMDIPVLGALFSSTRWQRNESELVVIVTPTVIDPNRPRAQDTPAVQPAPPLPAREALEPRLPTPGTPAPQPAAPARRP